MHSIEPVERIRPQSQLREVRKLFQGPISDFEDQTEVGDLVHVDDADCLPGNYRVVKITYRRCCKSFVLDNGATVYCSQAKPVYRKFVPMDADRKRGKYALVFERALANGESDIFSTPHIIPIFGRNHILHAECWCEPQPHKSDDGTYFFVHKTNH